MSHVALRNGQAINTGGGLYIRKKASVAAIQMHISENTAQNGGGIYITGSSSLDLRSSIISHNEANVGGGGVWISDESRLNLTGSSFLGNTAKEGGHVRVTVHSSVHALRTMFKGGLGSKKGGAIAVTNNGEFDSDNSVYEDNFGSYGGAIFVDGCLATLSNCTFSRNSAGESGYGGAIYNEKQSSILVYQSSFLHNTAAFGGVWYLTQVSSGKIFDTQLESNTAMFDGGGVLVDNSDFHISGGMIKANDARDHGGAILVQTGSTLVITTSFFTANTVGGEKNAGAGIGSAIFLSRGTDSVITSSVFSKNVALEFGTIYTADCTFLIKQCRFDRNTANIGGGIMIDRTSSGKIVKGNFSGNEAKTRGGAIALRGLARLIMYNATVGPDNRVNSIIGEGGGVSLNAFTRLEANGVFFHRNFATYGGGLAAVEDSNVDFTHCLFSNNKAVDGGGVSVLDTVDLAASSSTFVTNFAKSRGGGLYTTHSNCPINETHWYNCVHLRRLHFEDNSAISGPSFYWVFVNASDPLETAVSYDLGCPECSRAGNHTAIGGTNPTSVRLRQKPLGGVETGKVIGGAENFQVDCTDRYGVLSAFDTTTTCTVYKDSYEEGDLGIDSGNGVATNGIVEFPTLVFLGDGDRTYKIEIKCLIANKLSKTLKESVTIRWCQPGFAPVLRVCRPCQVGQYSPFGKWCLPCPRGGNCTSYKRTPAGLPMGVGFPHSRPGFWLHTAPQGAIDKRCFKGWDNQGPCKPGERLQNDTQACEDMEWPPFLLHMCLLKYHFYSCPRSYDACPGNFSMQTIGDRKNYVSYLPDIQCQIGYVNIMCGNCEKGYFPSASDKCVKCIGSESDQLLTKLFYGCLSAFVFGLAGIFILAFLWDGVYIGHAEKYYEPPEVDNSCRGRFLSSLKRINGTMKEFEKLKIALGLFQVLSSFQGTYELDWPPELQEFFKQFAIFENLDLFKLVSMDCLYKTDYFFSLKAVTMMPAVMCIILYILWRRGNHVFRHKLAFYPRFCKECGQPIDMYEINPKELAIRKRLKNHPWKLRLRHFYTFIFGGIYIYEDHGLDKEHEVRYTSVVKMMMKNSARKEDQEIKLPGVWAKYRKTKTPLLRKQPAAPISNRKEGSTDASSTTHPEHVSLARDREGRHFQGYSAFVHTGIECPRKDKARIYSQEAGQTAAGNWRMRVLLRIRFQTFKSKCLTILFWILLVTYPSISRKILMLFKCVQVGTQEFMMWDTQIVCYTDDWWWHASYAAGFGLVYIVGVPFLFWSLLKMARDSHVNQNADMILSQEKLRIKTLRLAKQDREHKGLFWGQMHTSVDERNRITEYLRRLNLRDARHKARLGFLYKNFKEEYYWYELTEFVFKLLMTGAMVHIVPGTVSQIMTAMFICFLGFGMYMWARPFVKTSNNILMIASKFQLFLTLNMGMLLKLEAPFFEQDSSMTELDASIISSLIIYTTCALLVSFIAAMVYDCLEERQAVKLERMHAAASASSKEHFKRLRMRWRLVYLLGKNTGVNEQEHHKKIAAMLKETREKYGAGSAEYKEVLERFSSTHLMAENKDLLKKFWDEFGPISDEYKGFYAGLKKLSHLANEKETLLAHKSHRAKTKVEPKPQFRS